MFISVSLCTYNGQDFLQQQLASIFSQTMQVDEVVICDEGSTDNTISIINSFEHAYPGIIRLYINEQKLGVVKNFEKAVSLCKGDFIFFSDQDDVWRGDKVEKCINFFNHHPGIYAVFSDANLIDDNSKEVGNTIWEILQFKELANRKSTVDIYRHIVFHANIVTGACLAIKKEAVLLTTPFIQVKDLYHDEWIALKLAALDKIHFLNDTLISYRVHSSQQTKVMRHKERVEQNAIKRSIILGENKVDALTYYRYWKRRSNTLEIFIKAGLEFNKVVLDEVKAERKKGLLRYYKTLNGFRRKKVLFHNWIKKEESISFSDVLFS